MIPLDLFQLGQRFIGEIKERPGDLENPFVQWAHSLCGLSADTKDEVPWCSSWLNSMAWLLRLPRSKSPAARSWLQVGRPVTLTDAKVGYDVVILQRGTGKQPDATVINAPGHVGIYAGWTEDGVLVLGGNQGDTVSIAPFSATRLLGVRRLKE